MPDPDRVAYLTQTTLSLDETKHVIEALRRSSPTSRGRTRKTSAMPRRIARPR